MGKYADKIIKKFTSRMQARLLLVFCVITLLLVGLMGRLVYIQQTDGDRYAKQVLSRQTYRSSVLPFRRGDILDSSGTVLAHSELQYRLILDPKLLLDSEEGTAPTVEALSKYFGIKADATEKVLKDKSKSQYVILQKNLSYKAVQNFKSKQAKSSNIIGVTFEEEYVRKYPFHNLAGDLLGFTGGDNRGFFGLEEYYNGELNGTNGREYGYYDSSLDIERIVKKAVNGNSVVTSINSDVQRIIQEKIKEFGVTFGSKNLSVLVMNPNNGEIIAMASGKEYDLNSPRNLNGIYKKEELSAMTEEQKTEALNNLWKNDAISSGYEPGSTYKPMTVAAGLEENLISEKNNYYCDGVQDVHGVKIHCSHRQGHGELTLAGALMQSCNDALMQIVAVEKRNLFSQYQVNFGMGQKTGIDLPGEASGIIKPADEISDVDLAESSFGQAFNVTMVQMAAAFSSLVNGGSYYQPHVMKQIINENGATVKTFNKILVRQTVSEKTSEFLQKTLYQTVEAGTAVNAQVKGYAIGGKTGTAQKAPYKEGKYVISFMGFAPAINPQMVIYIVVDDPTKLEHPTGADACTMASQILKEILPVMGIFPDGEIDYMLPTKAPTPSPAPTPTPSPQNAAGAASGPDKNTAGNSKENAAGTQGDDQNPESNEFNPAAIE